MSLSKGRWSSKLLGLRVGDEITYVASKLALGRDGRHLVIFAREIVIAVVGLVEKNDADFSVGSNAFEIEFFTGLVGRLDAIAELFGVVIGDVRDAVLEPFDADIHL